MLLERDAFYSMLGIAMRAGVLTLGSDGVLSAIASGKARFVLLDGGASENTKKKFRDSCAFYGAELYETAPDRLGYAIGKPGRMCAAVAKGTLGDKLHTLAQQG
ncbi:MAG: ribosomal L7Ae/L30e/S12e/Gadd45 family protein [Clostridia bacterium]|nr:ribosomal L7Ae/L30e/S12e/Gadd45 family protein [Clostridia bacterium]